MSNAIYQIWMENRELILSIFWFLSGILGAIIYNSKLKYDCKSTKVVWNILVILCGGLGFLFSILTCISLLIYPNENIKSKENIGIK